MNLTAHKLDRISLWSIGAISVFVVVAGVAQIRSELFSHDKIARAIREKLTNLQAQGADSYLSNTNDGSNLAAMQEKDTDSDGLNDFEEQYVHNTSPYLADSDSDGATDPAELAAGTNPNCPEGQSCTYGSSESAPASSTAVSAFADLDPSKLGIDTTTGTVDAKVLRQKLLDSGTISKEVLDKTDDATLLQLFNQTLQGGSTATGTDSVAAIQAQAEQLLKLSLEEKRQVLVQSGLDSATVEKLDEETVNSLLQQAVDQAVTQITQDANTNSNTSNSNTNEPK